MLIFGGWRVLGGQITIGVLLSFVLYVRQFFEPLHELFTTCHQRLAAAEAILRRLGLLKEPAEPKPQREPRRRKREERGEAGEYIDWAKADLPDEVLDWADVIIAHHFVDRWIGAQWSKVRPNHRVIWRTCGQSNTYLERMMAAFRPDGLEIVRYSPKERNLPNYAGEDALIRFYKDPAEWGGWHGSDPVVGNVTQNMAERADACGLAFWQGSTAGLPVRPAGPGSQRIGGTGPLSYEQMREYLRAIRCYLYTGTRPASYTLGLIEALMTGVPVVSIGPRAWGGWTPSATR